MKAAIFDVDGTLVDSVDFHARAWEEAFRYFGFRVPFGKIRAQIGKSGNQLIPAFLAVKDFEDIGQEIEDKKREIFGSKYLPHIQAYPMVRELFQKLKDEGWRLALASSAKRTELQTYKDRCEINGLVEMETSSDDVDKSQPRADIFLAVLNQLGDIKPSECVVIGAIPHDAEASRKVGIPSVGVLCGGFPRSRMRTSGFKQIFQHPADILLRYQIIHSLTD